MTDSQISMVVKKVAKIAMEDNLLVTENMINWELHYFGFNDAEKPEIMEIMQGARRYLNSF